MNRENLLGGTGMKPMPADAIDPLKAKAPPQPLKPTVTMAPTPPRIVLAVPSFDSWKADMAMAFTAMVGFLAHNRIAQVATANQKASMITMARNDLVQRAMEMNGDYILFIDSDLVFPPDAAARMLAHGKDIVGATYNKRVPPYETLGKLQGPMPSAEELAKGGLHKADFLPGGFLMVKMDVFRKLEWPWFFECYNRKGEPMDAFVGMMNDIYMLSMPQPVEQSLRENAELAKWLAEDWPMEPGNRVMSEDYAFMRKARRAGYDIWCDLALTWQMKHIGEQPVSCTPPGREGAPMPANPVMANRDAQPVAMDPGRPPAIVTV